MVGEYPVLSVNFPACHISFSNYQLLTTQDKSVRVFIKFLFHLNVPNKQAR